MPVIIHETFIESPIEVCFDLARDVEAIERVAPEIKQRAVGDVTSGVLELGDLVVWRTVQFGVPVKLSSRMVHVQRPYLFQDEMVKGPFHSFTHTHEFIEYRNGTLMIDHFNYTSPFSVFGVLADQLFLKSYMRKFIVKRARRLKAIAESEYGMY